MSLEGVSTHKGLLRLKKDSKSFSFTIKSPMNSLQIFVGPKNYLILDKTSQKCTELVFGTVSSLQSFTDCAYNQLDDQISGKEMRLTHR